MQNSSLTNVKYSGNVFKLVHLSNYTLWPIYCGNLTVIPTCGSSTNCCPEVGSTQLYSVLQCLYTVAIKLSFQWN